MSRKVLRSPRLARKEKKRKVHKAILWSSFSVVLLGSVLYGFSRPAFTITHIEVSGASRVPEARIMELVKEGMQGTYLGFISKAHTLLYPKSALTKTLTGSFPELRGVSLSLRNLASLHVAVHEREPKALWCSGVYGCFLVDDTGFAFVVAPEGSDGLFFRLEKSATTSPLAKIVVSKEELATVLSFLTQLEKLGLDPVKMVFTDEHEREVVLREGSRILFVDKDYTRTLASLGALLREGDVLPGTTDALRVSYIDLRYGNKIYFKPR